MVNQRIGLLGTGVAFLFIALRAQDDPPQLPVSNPICSFFGPNHDQYVPALNRHTAGTLTAQVASQLPALPSVPGGSRTDSQDHSSVNIIDKYIFQAISNAGVTPAPPTTDYEFIRRATLDLAGRIPTPDAVTSFVADTSAGKRATLVETLLASPNWIDKWTVWLADLYRNNSRNTQIPRYVPGVMAFNNYIRAALASGKPYDQMAREIISAQGEEQLHAGRD